MKKETNEDYFEFTKYWPDGMNELVATREADGTVDAIKDFISELGGGPMELALFGIALGKEHDTSNLIKLDYPFAESWERTLAGALHGVEVALKKSWEDSREGVSQFAYTQGYAEMTLFLERNKKEVVSALSIYTKMLVDKALSEPPNG